MPRLTIASWNINSVRARLPSLARLIDMRAPDILCLQEIKTVASSFPDAWFAERGYAHRLIHGQPAHHGVAILSRLPLADKQSHDWQNNGEARHIGGRLASGVRIENVYIPAGGDIPDPELNPKFAQKLAFYDRMHDWSQQLDTPTILVGDFNVAPLECDVWSHAQLLKIVSHTPIEVERCTRLQDSHGWIDIARRFVAPPEKLYSWWSYRARDWASSNRGRRLDHIWVSPTLSDRVHDFHILSQARGWEKPSDHAPLIATFDL